MKKKYLYAGLSLVAAVLIVTALYVLSGKTTAPGSAVKTGQQDLRGQVNCLPHKGTGPQTLECAYGIKDASGKYYGVTGDSMEITTYHIGETVIVSGVVSAPKTSETYDIVGNIEATSIRKDK